MTDPRYMHEASSQELTEELARRSRSCVVGLTGMGDKGDDYVLYSNGKRMETLGLSHALAGKIQRELDDPGEEEEEP